MTQPQLWALRSFSAAAFCIALSSFGQPAPAPSPVPPPASADETVTLSPFEVASGTRSNGYISSQSVTGSRVATQISELPFNINVVTQEFLDDFAVYELEENFAYSSALNGMDAGGSFNLRGYGVQKSLRNGFSRIGLVDRVSVDRIEIIKGPSAAIYGEARPGGLLNVITHRPREKKQQQVRVELGSFDTYRLEVKSDGPVPLTSKTFYSVSAAAYERDYSQPHTYTRQRTAAVALLHKFQPKTTLLLEGEYLARFNNPLQAVPFLDVGAPAPTTQRVVGFANELRDFSVQGSFAESHRDISSFTGTFEHTFNPVFSVRASANYYKRHLWTGGSGSGTYNPTTRILNRNGPGYGYINEDGGGVQADLLAHYWLANRKIENRTLFTIDYSSYYRVDPQWRTNASGAGSVADLVSRGLYVQNLSIDTPDYRFPGFSPVYFPRINRWQDNRFDAIGNYLRHQAAFFNKRLLAVGGVRYDTVKYWITDRAQFVQTNGVTPVRTKVYDLNKTTPMVGLNVAVAPGHRVYVNYSESFFADSQNVTINSQEVAETGYGIDYGIKSSFLDDRLSFVLGGFLIERENVNVTVLNDAGNTETVAEGSQRSTGVELDGNADLVGKKLTMLFGGSINTTELTNFGRDLDAVGRQVSGVPKYQAYLALKYTWDEGWMKGLSSNLGIRYTGSAYPDTQGGAVATGANSTDLNANGIFEKGEHDGRRDIQVPSSTVVDFGTRYRWRPQGSRFSHTFSLNVTNLFDKRYLSPKRNVGQPRGIYGGYGIQF